MYRRVEAADGKVFQKNVAVTTASNRHLWEEFKAADSSLSPRKVQFRNGTGIGVWIFANQSLAPSRRSKLKWPGAFMDEEGEQRIAEATLVGILQPLLLC